MKLNKLYTRAIWNLTNELQNLNQPESALFALAQILKDTIGCDAVFVWLLREGSDELSVISGAYNRDLTGTTTGHYEGMIGHVMETSETMIYNVLPEDEENQIPISDIKSQIVSAFGMPNRPPYGAVQVINKNNGSFNAEDSQLVDYLSALAALDFDDKGFFTEAYPKKEPILELKGIEKEFVNGTETTKVLRGVDLDIYPGEFLVVLGESGCGKTTLMNIIGGMSKMSCGKITLEGKDFSNPSDKEIMLYRRNYIGFIFQSYNLMPNLTALENLEFIAEICQSPNPPEKMLDQVGLSAKANNFPSQMSGGQQQRISIARALTKNPLLILADEPTAALDYETSIEVLKILEDIVRLQNKTVVMITHNPEIAKMADRVVKVRNGSISGTRINCHPLHAEELVW